MNVEPVFVYRRPGYPTIEESIQLQCGFFPKTKALVAAMLVISGSLPGCVFAGGMREYRPVPKQELIQLLQYEAEKFGVALDHENNPVVSYPNANVDFTLDLYDREKRIGAALIDRTRQASLYNENNNSSDSALLSLLRNQKVSIPAAGSLEDGQPVNYFLSNEIEEFDMNDYIQSFREFLEWLQAEGII